MNNSIIGIKFNDLMFGIIAASIFGVFAILLASAIAYSTQKQFEIPKAQVVQTVTDVVYRCGDSSYSIPTTSYVKQPFNGTAFMECLKESGFEVVRTNRETK